MSFFVFGLPKAKTTIAPKLPIDIVLKDVVKKVYVAKPPKFL